MTWAEARSRISVAFDGETLGPKLHQELEDIYAANPSSILNAYEAIATDPQVRSKWAVLKHNAIAKALNTKNPTLQREKLIRNADQWLRNAGHAYPTWEEVKDELFGDRGTLRTIHTDKLEQRYHQAWQSLQPQEATA